MSATITPGGLPQDQMLKMLPIIHRFSQHSMTRCAMYGHYLLSPGAAKLPELNHVDTTRICNGANSLRLALLYRQNFGRVQHPYNYNLTKSIPDSYNRNQFFLLASR